MSDHPAGKPGPPVLKWALWGVAAFGVAAVVYIIGGALFQPARNGPSASASKSRGAPPLKGLARGEMAKLQIPADPGAAPANTFVDATGKSVQLGDFKGKVVVLNLWATWCAPCQIEMPTLARLKAEYAGKPVEVVALSIDSPSAGEKAKAFISKHAPLDFYNDPTMKFAFAIKPIDPASPSAPALPTTIIYGPDGVERARLTGGADWSGPDAKAVVDAVLAES